MVKYSSYDLDSVFGALADPSRRQIVLTLRAGEATVEELGRPLGISTPGVMKHLAVLEKSGLILTEKKGRSRFCSLKPDRLNIAEDWIEEAKLFWQANLTRLANHLEEK